MLPPGISFNALSPKAHGGQQDGDAAERLLGLGRDRRDEQGRLLALHAEHQPAVRPARSARHAARTGPRAVFARHQRWAEGVRAGGARLGPADPVRRPGRPLAGADRRGHAGGRRCRRAAPADPRPLRPLAGHRPRQAEGPHVPHRPPGRLQRPDADGRAGGRRDGPQAGRRAARRQRRAGGDGVLRGAPDAPTAGRPRPDPAPNLDASPTETSHAKTLPYPGRRRRRRHARRAATACTARPGRTARCASSSAFRPAAAPTRWRASSARSSAKMWGPAGHRRDQGRRRRRAGRRIRLAAADRRQRAADGAHQQPRAGAEPAAQAALQRRARLHADRRWSA